jgi:hypothetical protein
VLAAEPPAAMPAPISELNGIGGARTDGGVGGVLLLLLDNNAVLNAPTSRPNVSIAAIIIRYGDGRHARKHNTVLKDNNCKRVSSSGLSEIGPSTITLYACFSAGHIGMRHFLTLVRIL